MKRILSSVLAITLLASFAGCGEKAEIKKESTTTTPGGETTVTQKTTVESSGSNPPPVNP